jgi:hypothetical protein
MYLPAHLSAVIDFDSATLRVSSRESSRREFKARLDRAELGFYSKTLVAFANNDGGTIIFGISDRPRKIVGIDPASELDEARWLDCLRSHFDPVIDIAIRTYDVAGRHVCAVATPRSERRPILCRKNLSGKVPDRKGVPRDQSVLGEGIVYYRYCGQSRPIGYAELAAVLEERDQRRTRALLENLRIIERVGFERIGIVDASMAAAPGKETQLYVSRDTARSLNFIEKGRFVETNEEGAPAYVVVGTVRLNEVVHAPLDEADKNLPNEATAILRPHIEATYGKGIKFTGTHLAKLAAHLGLRRDGVCDPRYCVEERKLKRVFYTRGGIQKVREAVSADPLGALRSFAGRGAIERYSRIIGNTAVAPPTTARSGAVGDMVANGARGLGPQVTAVAIGRPARSSRRKA